MEEDTMVLNPYSIKLGGEPKLAIARTQQAAMLESAFQMDDPSNQVFMITGPRGAGKTVFMTHVANKLADDSRWIVVELNPERDLLHALASKLSGQNALVQVFKEAKKIFRFSDSA